MDRDVRERPILFSAGMVRAILDGRKVQTRRLVKPQPGPPGPSHAYFHEPEGWWTFGDNSGRTWRCPYGVAGDRLYVRETWTVCHDHRDDVDFKRALVEARSQVPWSSIVYRADALGGDCESSRYPWRPGIHMPRWASRITLEVTSVRVERLQAISEADAQAEGIERPVIHDPSEELGFKVHPYTGDYRDGFRVLWDSLNGRRAPWKSNPWVWVVSFRQASQ